MNLATGPAPQGPGVGEGFWSERLPRRFALTEHRADLLGEPHGYGCLPFDAAGPGRSALALHDLPGAGRAVDELGPALRP